MVYENENLAGDESEADCDPNDCPIRKEWGYCHCDYPGHDRALTHMN